MEAPSSSLPRTVDELSSEKLASSLSKHPIELLLRNREWSESQKAKDPEFFQKLSKDQRPNYLVIGCSDSRVSPSELMQVHPGEVFMQRNVANMVIHTDMNSTAVIQYAVDVLKVRHVIVMGHYGCGGVKASMEAKSHGLIDKWLRQIKDVYRLYRDELDGIGDDKLRFKRLVELNVIENVFNVRKTNIFQGAKARGQELSVHGWVYDMSDGLIRDLEVDKTEQWSEIEKIYALEFPVAADSGAEPSQRSA